MCERRFEHSKALTTLCRRADWGPLAPATAGTVPGYFQGPPGGCPALSRNRWTHKDCSSALVRSGHNYPSENETEALTKPLLQALLPPEQGSAFTSLLSPFWAQMHSLKLAPSWHTSVTCATQGQCCPRAPSVWAELRPVKTFAFCSPCFQCQTAPASGRILSLLETCFLCHLSSSHFTFQ